MLVSDRLVPPRPSTGGPLCCMSILRNNNIPCRYFCNVHVDSNLKWSKVPCQISEKVHVMLVIFFLMLISSMSHVDLKDSCVVLSNLRVKGPTLSDHKESEVKRTGNRFCIGRNDRICSITEWILSEAISNMRYERGISLLALVP